tara:strand:+ start:4146 stop:5477 length:1332 start_codon:yes stop_codon:yes gene_type:complete
MKKNTKRDSQSNNDFDILSKEDFGFISSKSRAILLKSPTGARNLMIIIGLFFIVFLVWASLAETEEITTGQGRVIPEKKLHSLQSFEGGVISELFVNVGELVDADTPLIKIDSTQQNSDLQEIKRQLDVLNANKERLQAELKGRPLNFSPDLKKSIPKLLEKEEELYNSRTRQYLANKNYYDEKINEANSTKKYTFKSLRLAKKELDAIKPLLKDRAVSEVEVLKLESSFNELKSKYASILIDIKALTSQREEKLLAYRNETQEELSDVIGNIKIISPSQVGAQDRVSRAIIRSPIDGIVQRIISVTVGSVVEAGEDIIEILPLEDTLLIEAKVKPTDIGFIEEGQKATVKFSAFDFTIYGGLEGELIHISPDAIVEKNGNTTETFYLIKVKTNKNYLGSINKPLKIIPGMDAEVDILTGKKTILSFLLKPVLRAKYSSLRER